MTLLIISLVALALLWPLIRFVAAIAIFAWVCSMLINVGSEIHISPEANATTSYNPANLTFQQLVDYPANCEKKEQQLKELTQLQKNKNFNSDPDVLNDNDRAYNSRLKATIWWYSYGCEK